MANPDTEIKKLYYSISEVSKITDLKQYVLRYWETEFSILKPQKNRAGNRTYRQADIDIVLKIKDLLYNQKYTIEGARQQLRSKLTDTDEIGQDENAKKYRELLSTIKGELKEIVEIISKR